MNTPLVANCPYCGDPAKTTEWQKTWWVGCYITDLSEDGGACPGEKIIGVSYSKDLAIAQWNRSCAIVVERNQAKQA